MADGTTKTQSFSWTWQMCSTNCMRYSWTTVVNQTEYTRHSRCEACVCEVRHVRFICNVLSAVYKRVEKLNAANIWLDIRFSTILMLPSYKSVCTRITELFKLSNVSPFALAMTISIFESRLNGGIGSENM